MSDTIYIDDVAPRAHTIGTSVQAPTGSAGVSLTPAPITTPRTIDLRSGKLQEGVTLNRASVGSRINGNGQIAFEPADAPRWDYDAAQARTNLLKNSSMVGAIVGGRQPNGWNVNSGNGVSFTVVSLGTVGNVNYMDVSFAGTTTAQTNIGFTYDNQNISTTLGQSFTGSAYFQLLSGTIPATPIQVISEANATGSNFAYATVPMIPNATFTRASITKTINSAASVSSRYYLQITIPTGTAVDFTLRVGSPQYEFGTVATPVINTYGTMASVIDNMGGLLIEPSATNYCTMQNPNGFQRITATAGIDDPAGGTNALRLVASGVSDPIAQMLANVAPSGRTFTRSYWLRDFDMRGQASLTNTFDYGLTGTEAPNAATAKTNNRWQRFAATRTFGAMISTQVYTRVDPFDPGTNAPVAGSAIDASHWQYEDGTVATSYILPTQTRAPDVLTIDWARRGIRDGVTTIRYTFDDETTQDVATTITQGKSVVPTNLRRSRLRQITPVV